MKYVRTILVTAAATAGLCASAAALPMAAVPDQASNLMHKTAVVCDGRGRCYESRRHVYREPHYNDDAYVGPRNRYYEGPSMGFRFGFGDRWR